MPKFLANTIYRISYKSGLVQFFLGKRHVGTLIRSLNNKTRGRFSRVMLLQSIAPDWERIKKAIDPNKKTFAIYLGSIHREKLGNIPDKLRFKGYNVLTFLNPVMNDEYEKKQNAFNVSPQTMGIIANTLHSNVSICMEPRGDLPAYAKAILFVHDIGDINGDIDNALNRQAYKYFFLPSPYVVDRVKQKVLRRKDTSLINRIFKKKVCLIPGGYPKLDSNLICFEKYKQNSKVITYATTGMEKDMLGMGSVEQYGDKIIRAVLDNFPDYNLIFRPHPYTLHQPEVQNIAKNYAEYSHFMLDDNAGSYMENYSKSALMITDMSGTAYTYAFSTLRPVIFFSPDESEVTKRFYGLQFFQDRSKIGYIAENINEMIEKIKLLLAHKDEFTEKIRAYRDSTIYNIGKSEDYFVDNIEYILEDKKHPDWIYI